MNCLSDYGDYYMWNVWANDSNNNLNWSRVNFSIITPKVDLDIIIPIVAHANITQNSFFNVTLNVSCVVGSCGTVNVSLDPEMIERILGNEQVNQGVNEDNLEEEVDNFETKSSFEKVIEFFSKLFLRGNYLN